MLTGNIDYPGVDGQQVSSVIEIKGWMAGTGHLESLELHVDGNYVCSPRRGMLRTDVERDHPDFAMASESGFSDLFDTLELPDGTHTAAVSGRITGGESLTLTRSFLVRNADAGNAARNCSAFFRELPRPGACLRNKPLRIFLEPSKLCNVSCLMCRSSEYLQRLRDSGSKIQVMPRGVFEKLKALLPYAIDIIPSGWGEPYTNPLFREMLSAIRASNQEATVGFNTNALLIGEKEAENLVENKVHHVTVSVDSPDRTKYERIRRGADFDLLVSNIKRIIKARKRHRTEYPRLHFEYVVMNLNVTEMPEFVSFCADFEPECIVFTDVGKLPPGFEDLYLGSHASFIDVYLDTRRRAREHRMNIAGNALHSFEKALRKEPVHAGVQNAPAGEARFQPHLACYEPFQTVFVNCSGELNPCCVAATIKMGRLNSETFDGIWNGPAYQEFRAEFLRGQPASEACVKCLENRLYDSIPAMAGRS